MKTFLLSVLLVLPCIEGLGVAQILKPTFPKPDRKPLVWNEKNAAHLMRRAGFSASYEEIQEIVERGFSATLDDLLHPENVDDSRLESGAKSRPYGLSAGPVENRIVNVIGVRDVWIYRMLRTKRQLREKLTFFWHDHFATSLSKVVQVTRDEEPIPYIHLQNQLLRKHALGNFKEFVHAMARDPAMLIWLDNRLNRVGKPNENWARELLELFTMGVGNYTDEDVREAARAFTGWGLSFLASEFRFRPELHDHGQKTFLGVTGNLNGDDIIDIVFERPATAEFISRKLWEYFVYPDPSADLVRELGRVFRDSGYEIRVLMSAILRHPDFFSDRAFRALVKSPIELTIGFMREVRQGDGFTSFSVSAQLAQEDMGQGVYTPPDVGGWTSGAGWINTASMLQRFNGFLGLFASRRPHCVDIECQTTEFRIPTVYSLLIDRYGLTDGASLVDHFLDRLLQGDVPPEVAFILKDYMDRDENGAFEPFRLASETADAKVAGLLYLIALLPEYHLN